MTSDYQHTSHVATLPCGQSIFYTDSGAPSTSTYTTVVALHGTGFTGKTFYPLLPLAHKNGMRFIIPNRPDYSPSSLLSQSELDDYNTGKIQSVQRNATWLSQFLLGIIKEGGLPKVKQSEQNECREGGIVILAWSMGVITALPLFYALGPGWLEEGAYGVLKDYIRDLVLYGSYPSVSILLALLPQPEANSHIQNPSQATLFHRLSFLPQYLRNPSRRYTSPMHPPTPTQARTAKTPSIVQRKKSYGILENGSEGTTSTRTITGIRDLPFNREMMHIVIEDFDRTRNYSKTTVENMHDGAKRMIWQDGLLDWEAASRSEVPEVSDFDRRDVLRRHLSDTGFGLRDTGDLPSASFTPGSSACSSSSTPPILTSEDSEPMQFRFPSIPITYISETHTVGIRAWNAAQDERRWRESSSSSPPPSGGAPRVAKWVRISGGNHFAHWEMSELFLKGVVAGIAAKEGERVVV